MAKSLGCFRKQFFIGIIVQHGLAQRHKISYHGGIDRPLEAVVDKRKSWAGRRLFFLLFFVFLDIPLLSYIGLSIRSRWRIKKSVAHSDTDQETQMADSNIILS